jgi:hypothetical protein
METNWMKSLFALVCIAVAPAVALAQTATPPKPAAKAAAAKPAAKAPVKRKLAPSAQKAVEEVTPIDDDPSIVLTDADREVARKVHVGDIPCELGATVKVTPMKREGMFMVTTKGHRFRMHPVESRTGAIRLEDPQRGAMWLQLGNKSMLMSQKLGQRLADECMSPDQVTAAEALKKNPMPSLLEPLPAAVPGPKTAGEDQPPPKTN